MWYGYYLGAAGRLEEAIVERQRSRELDPLNLTAGTGIATVLAQMGRQDEARSRTSRPCIRR
jgi:Flp pilus assembly protein TadD